MADSRGVFDRWTDQVAEWVAHWAFFAGCFGLVLVWLVEGAIRMVTTGPAAFLDQTFQLQINTTTTIVTFLLLALLHNSQHRFEQATNQRLQELTERLPGVPGDPVKDEGQRADQGRGGA